MNGRIHRHEKNREGKSAYKSIVPAVEQASRILLCLGENPTFKMKLADICRQVGAVRCDSIDKSIKVC